MMKFLLAFVGLLAAVSAYPGNTRNKWGVVDFTGQPVSGQFIIVFNQSDITGDRMYVTTLLDNVPTTTGVFSAIVHEFGDVANPGNCVYDGATPMGGFPTINNSSFFDFNEECLNNVCAVPLLGINNFVTAVGRALILYEGEVTCENGVLSPANPTFIDGGVIAVGTPILANLANLASNVETDNTQAICQLVDRNPNDNLDISGTVYFTQSDPLSPTVVSAVINGLSGDRHGFHLHQFGQVGGEGNVFNPNVLPHSIPPNFPRQDGDMGNILFYENNVAFYTLENNQISLASDINRPNTIIGRAVAIKMNEDDCSSASDGNAGAIIASCVVAEANPANFNVPTIPAGAGEQDLSNCPNVNVPSSSVPVNTGTDVVDNSATSVFVNVFLFAASFLVALF